MKISDVDIVFSDWTAAFRNLNEQINSPQNVRRSFSQLIDLSQKLTATMYKEFPGAWEAKNFPGWSNVSELFKALRNYDQHEELIKQYIEETSHLKVPPEDEWPEINIGIRGTLKNVDPLSKKNPTSNFALMAADPKTGRMTNKEIGKISSRTYSYILSITRKSDRAQKINRYLKEIGTSDIHILARKYNEILTNYLQFYKAELAKTKSNK